MSTAEHELEQAVHANSPITSLIAVCRAWQLVPSTRLAQLARGLAAQLPADSVPGANQDEREAAWHELAVSASLVELQSLLATPWSKKPKDAARRLEQFRRLGPDPRIVGALLELDTGGRYASAAGNRFWQDAYDLLLGWGSVEAAARIPKAGPTSDYASPWSAARFSSIFEPLAIRWAGRWPREPELAPWVLRHVEALEARLEPHEALMTGLVGAVSDAPEADTPKLVFADALTERGDPRGEFIALQFAHAAGELTLGKRERMQRLLSASGVSWFDGLEGQVAPLAVFHKGFLNEVRLETRAPTAITPAWRTIEVIDTAAIATSLSGFLGAPNLKRVHSLRSVRGATLEELARSGGERTFQLVEVEHLGARTIAAPAWRVDRLRLRGHVDQALWWLLGAPFATCASTVEFALTQGFDRVGATLRALEDQAPAVIAVEFAANPPAWPMLWHGDWKLRLTRDAKGTFSTLALSLGAEVLGSLDVALASLEPKQLKSARVSTVLKRGPVWREATRALIDRSLAAQSRLKNGEFELEKPVPLPPKPIVHEGR